MTCTTCTTCTNEARGFIYGKPYCAQCADVLGFEFSLKMKGIKLRRIQLTLAGKFGKPITNTMFGALLGLSGKPASISAKVSAFIRNDIALTPTQVQRALALEAMNGEELREEIERVRSNVKIKGRRR